MSTYYELHGPACCDERGRDRGERCSLSIRDGSIELVASYVDYAPEFGWRVFAVTRRGHMHLMERRGGVWRR